MFKKALVIAIVYCIFGGCSNKLNVLAPYKESVSVYGLLNQDSSIQYIRVERVFLGAGNAYTMAQNQDSVYFGAGELTVSLQRWNLYTSTQVSVDVPASNVMQIVLTDTLMQANAGTFNANERVYKTNHTLYANDTNCVYKLIIQNNKTGKQYTAQTPMVAFNTSLLLNLLPNADNAIGPNYYSSSGTPSGIPLDIVPGNGGIVTYQYNSPVNAGVCSLTMRLFYTENNGGISTPKYADIGLGTYYPTSTVGGENQKFDQSGASTLSDIAATIPVPANSSITRTANYVQFLLIAGGPDLALYNQVNSATPLSQSTPNYSNISGGIGVFSSRNQFSIKRILSDQNNQKCLDTLAGSSITCKLQFLNYNGVLVPCH